MCRHEQIVDARGDLICTQCGVILRDDDVPDGWFTTPCKEEIIVSKSIQRQCDLVAAALRLPDCVALTAGELAVTHGFRSSNCHAIAACVFIAAKRHRLDRLEREMLLAVRGLDNRLFLKYLKGLKSQEAQHYITGLETLKRMVPRVACDLVPDVKKRAAFARGLERTLNHLYPIHADSITSFGILKMAITHAKELS